MNRPFLSALFLAAGVATGLAQDGPPVDTEALLKTVETMATKNSVTSKAQFEQVLKDLRQASASNSTAIHLYEESIRGTQFIGLNREQTQFQEWKKKEAEKLKSKEMQNAARLHLQYLVLSLQYANGTPIKELIPALILYTNEVTGAEEPMARQELMKKGIGDSVIARWYGVSRFVSGKGKDWEPNPGNIDGIYAKAILPQWRADKDPRILAYWDTRIQRETQTALGMPAKFDQDQFVYVKKPALLWSRAKDRLAIGQRNTALKEMVEIAKSYPDHPDNATWLEELKGLLQPSSAPVAPPAEAEE